MKLLEAVRGVNYLPETGNLWQEWVQQTYGKPTEECLRHEFQSYARDGFGGNAVVFGLMLARAMLFSEATFKFRDHTSGKLFGNTDLLALESPWPNGTTGELLIRMIQDADLAGNAYIRQDPDRLVRLRPDWVSIVRVGSGQADQRSRWDVIGYTYWLNGPGGGEMEFYPIEEVAHWSPIPDPLNDYKGMSWLTPVIREINTDLGMTDFKRKFIDNNATPNLLIKYKQRLTDGALTRLQGVWNAKYGGTDGMKTAFLDSGADHAVIGSSFSEMHFTDVQAAGENRIAVASGVPGIVAGLKEGLSAATYSNYQQAMRRFADITMRPLWRSACACLSQIVTAPTGTQLWYDTSDIAALREGDQDRAKTAQTEALTMQALILAGYKPDTVTAAVTGKDLSLLVHSGAIPTALYPEGQVPTEPAKEVGKWKG